MLQKHEFNIRSGGSIPSNIQDDFIGDEKDEPGYRDPFWPWQAHGFYSDIAFIETKTGLMLSNDMLIAGTHPEDPSTQCTVSYSGTPFPCYELGRVNITSASDVVTGFGAFKTGATTGTTKGYVSQTCVDRNGDLGDGQNGMMLCQNIVKANPGNLPLPSAIPMAIFGDSGSSVLGHPSVGLGDSPLIGVLWGGDTYIPDEYWYSPWVNISNPAAGMEYGIPVTFPTSTNDLSNSYSDVAPGYLWSTGAIVSYPEVGGGGSSGGGEGGCGDEVFQTNAPCD